MGPLRLTPEEKTLMEAEFVNTARPLLDLPEVAKLAQYNHHRGKPDWIMWRRWPA